MVLVATDIIRFMTILSIPMAAVLGLLTFTQLCVVAVTNTVCQIAFASASRAHLRALVRTDQLIDANGRLESTTWASLTVGRSLGGAFIAIVTATGALVLDACSIHVRAFAISRIRTPEPDPPQLQPSDPKLKQVLGGLDFVRRDPPLRRILANWIVFAGASGMAFPISTAFYLTTSSSPLGNTVCSWASHPSEGSSARASSARPSPVSGRSGQWFDPS